MKIMKRLILLTILIFLTTKTTSAEIKTMYKTSEPIQIFTKLGYETVIVFETEIEYVSVGNTNAFGVEMDGKRDKLTILPKIKGRNTNMIVILKGNDQFVFTLIEDNSTRYYNLVQMKNTLDMNYKDIINIVNKKTIGIDPALKNIIKIYDVKENTFNILGNVKLSLKRAVILENVDKSVFWLRIENISLTEKIKLVFSKSKVSNHIIHAIAYETNKDELQPEEFIDMYVFLEGASIDKSYKYSFTINGAKTEIDLKNIPYDKQDFSVFINDDNGELVNFTLGGYTR